MGRGGVRRCLNHLDTLDSPLHSSQHPFKLSLLLASSYLTLPVVLQLTTYSCRRHRPAFCPPVIAESSRVIRLRLPGLFTKSPSPQLSVSCCHKTHIVQEIQSPHLPMSVSTTFAKHLCFPKDRPTRYSRGLTLPTSCSGLVIPNTALVQTWNLL